MVNWNIFSQITKLTYLVQLLTLMNFNAHSSINKTQINLQLKFSKQKNNSNSGRFLIIQRPSSGSIIYCFKYKLEIAINLNKIPPVLINHGTTIISMRMIFFKMQTQVIYFYLRLAILELLQQGLLLAVILIMWQSF